MAAWCMGWRPGGWRNGGGCAGNAGVDADYCLSGAGRLRYMIWCGGRFAHQATVIYLQSCSGVSVGGIRSGSFVGEFGDEDGLDGAAVEAGLLLGAKGKGCRGLAGDLGEQRGPVGGAGAAGGWGSGSSYLSILA